MQPQRTGMASYNGYVKGRADTVTSLAGITFRAVGSTASVEARCSTQTHTRTSHCPGVARVEDVPIYYYRCEKVTDNFGNLYDGSWLVRTQG